MEQTSQGMKGNGEHMLPDSSAPFGLQANIWASIRRARARPSGMALDGKDVSGEKMDGSLQQWRHPARKQFLSIVVHQSSMFSSFSLLNSSRRRCCAQFAQFYHLIGGDLNLLFFVGCAPSANQKQQSDRLKALSVWALLTDRIRWQNVLVPA